MALMTMQDIITQHEKLEYELVRALATMERKDVIFQLRAQLVDLQNQCPHCDDKYNFQWKDDHCPYCGKKVGKVI